MSRPTKSWSINLSHSHNCNIKLVEIFVCTPYLGVPTIGSLHQHFVQDESGQQWLWGRRPLGSMWSSTTPTCRTGSRRASVWSECTPCRTCSSSPTASPSTAPSMSTTTTWSTSTPSNRWEIYPELRTLIKPTDWLVIWKDSIVVD